MSAAITAAAVVAGGTYLASENAKSASSDQSAAYRQMSDLQYERAMQGVKKVPEFRPVTVTSSFGTPKYTYDASGRLTGVDSTASPWLAKLQEQGQGYAGQYMDLQGKALQDTRLQDAATRAYNAGGTVYDYAGQVAGQAPGLYNIGQEMYGMGRNLNQYANQAFDTRNTFNNLGTSVANQAGAFQQTGQTLQNTGADIYNKAAQALPENYDVTQATQDYYDRMQRLVAPDRERQLSKTRQGLFNTGRAGLSIGATQEGGQLATNPEMAAYYNAIAQQDLNLANQSEQQAISNLSQRTNMAQGLYNTGLSQYQGGLNANQMGINANTSAGSLYGQGVNALQTGAGITNVGSNILGQGVQATQAGTGQLQASSGLFGQGTALYGSGGNLSNQYYNNITAAQTPFTNQMAQLTNMEAMRMQPVTQGMQYGSTVTTQGNNIANAYINAANAGSGAMMNSIDAQYRANSIDPWSGMIIGAGKTMGSTDWGSMFNNSSSTGQGPYGGYSQAPSSWQQNSGWQGSYIPGVSRPQY